MYTRGLYNNAERGPCRLVRRFYNSSWADAPDRATKQFRNKNPGRAGVG